MYNMNDDVVSDLQSWVFWNPKSYQEKHSWLKETTPRMECWINWLTQLTRYSKEGWEWCYEASTRRCAHQVMPALMDLKLQQNVVFHRWIFMPVELGQETVRHLTITEWGYYTIGTHIKNHSVITSIFNNYSYILHFGMHMHRPRVKLGPWDPLIYCKQYYAK